MAKELIDWLIEHKEASERDTAIKIMQKLLDQSIIHHGKSELCVCVCVLFLYAFSIFYNSKHLSFFLDIFWERSAAF